MIWRALVCGIVLAGCVTTEKTTTNAACPPIKTYAKTQEQQVANEMTELPAGSEIKQWIVDYIAERDMLRACAATK